MIAEVGPGDPRLPEVLGVMAELRRFPPEELERRYTEGHPDGYRLVGLWEDGACRAAAGYRISTSLANGRYLYVDDLVTASEQRSQGLGKRLLDHLVGLAQQADCDCVTLDSGVHRFAAHRFYMREGFVISSHHFYRRLRPGARASSMMEDGV